MRTASRLSELPAPTEGTRDRLAQAAITVIARDGFEVMSFRTVAREAGVAAGTVQHHFASRHALLVAAFDRTVETISARVETVRQDGPIQSRLGAVLRAALPLDHRRRAEAIVWVVLTAAAATNPGLARIHQRALLEFRATLRSMISDAQAGGEVDKTVQPTDAANLIIAVVDGLTMQGLAPTNGAVDLVPTLDLAIERALSA